MVTHTIGRVDNHVALQRILISVSDKTGLETLAPALVRNFPDIEILSTGGTFRALQKLLPGFNGLRDVASYTGSPETDGGLVKTLDYKLYLGILGEAHNPHHQQDRERSGAGLIDAVVVNLYPFAQAVSEAPENIEQGRGNIDIGGVTLLRAAAKNYLRVAVLSSPKQYASLEEELVAHRGVTSLSYRAGLARHAFSVTAAYDAAIAEWFAGKTTEDLTNGYLTNG